MTTSESTTTSDASLVRDLLGAARHYFRGQRMLVVVAIIAVAAGIAFNWSWLAAAGIAPILLTLLPCLVMCGAGLCMSKMLGGSCEEPTTPSRDAAEAATSAATLGIAKTDSPSVGGSSCCHEKIGAAKSPGTNHPQTVDETLLDERRTPCVS